MSIVLWCKVHAEAACTLLKDVANSGLELYGGKSMTAL